MARPPFKPTAAMRLKVSVAAGGGMSHEEIAIALGISRNTLEKHFADQLSTGSFQRRMEVLSAMHKAAKGGNVTAQRAYLSTTPALVVPPAPDDQPAPRAPKLGKKDQANADAVTASAGTDWDSILPGARAPLQ